MTKHRRPSNSSKPRTGRSLDSSRGSLCPYCGKRSYMSRKYAKEAARIQYPTEHLSAYRCVSAPEGVDTARLWHLGHLAPMVIKGKAGRGQIHGSPELVNPREAKRGPIPAALRATMEPKDNDTIDDQGEPMPTIGESATVNLQGFDRRKGGYRGVSAASPTKDKVALVHGALRAYALTHGFEQMEEYGTDGYVGRVSVRAVCRELFESDELAGDHLDNLVKQITQAGNKAGLIRCVDSATRQTGVLPIWWVAADYERVIGHAPLDDPAKRPVPPKTPPAARESKATPAPDAPPAAPAKKKGRSGGRVKGSRNRSRIELLSLAERTLKELGRPVILEELYGSADFPVTKHSLRDVIEELSKERRVIRRTIEPEDRKAIKRAGGPRNLAASTWVLAHHTIAPFEGGERQIATATWGLGRIDDRPDAPPEPEDDLGAVRSALEEIPGVAVVDVPAEPQDDPEDSVEAAIQAAEAKARKATRADEAQLEALLAEVADLRSKLAKVTKQRDRLLAIVNDSMEDE